MSQNQRQGPTPSPTRKKGGGVISFDMKTDDMIRNHARQGYDISKILKESGVKFKRVISASGDPTVRKLFKLPIDSPHLCVELEKISDEAKMAEIINDMETQLIMMRDVEVIDKGEYKLDNAHHVYRILIKRLSTS